MEGMWTIAELAAEATDALAADRPVMNGRVRDMPNERLIRWYTTIGLIDPPLARRGRVALYGPRHLLQLVAVKRRQAAGRSIAEIQAELTGAPDTALAAIADLPTPEPPRPTSARPRFWTHAATTTAHPAPQNTDRHELVPPPPADHAPARAPRAGSATDSTQEQAADAVEADTPGRTAPAGGAADTPPRTAPAEGAAGTPPPAAPAGGAAGTPPPAAPAGGAAGTPAQAAPAGGAAAPRLTDGTEATEAGAAVDGVVRPRVQDGEEVGGVVQGVRLGAGVTLLLDDEEALDAGEVAAIVAAARPLLEELTRLGRHPGRPS